jgi:hypothetical protein
MYTHSKWVNNKIVEFSVNFELILSTFHVKTPHFFPHL